jgi:hypothetical protein
VSLGRGRDLTTTLDGLGKSTRVVITSRDEVKKDSTDASQIAEVVTFFKKYPSGWVNVSGAGGDYDIFLYEDAEMIGRLGVTASSGVRPGEDTLNVGDSFRRVPASDVLVFMRRLGLPWPKASQ